MFRKLFGAGKRGAAATPSPPPPPPTPVPPYQPWPAGEAANGIYNLLFCDDAAGYAPTRAEDWAPWQTVLYGPAQDAGEVAALAADETAESRVRVLAHRWLAAHGRTPPKGVVLGVVLEVRLDGGGLDVLAAYADGRVRYINQSGKMAFVEAPSLADVNDMARRLVELAGPVVARIGPWERPRPPPPAAPEVRVSFLVSDGLYFGQGPWAALQQDPMAAPLLALGAQLLVRVTEATTNKQASG